MKAKLAKAPSFGHWIYEIKFDGWRALALKGGNQVRLLSRNSKDLGAKFPEIMVSIVELNGRRQGFVSVETSMKSKVNESSD